MKKEILFAISIGLIVGIVIAIGMYRAQSAMRSASTINTQLQTDATPIASSTPSQSTQDAFMVSEPLDESLIETATVRISGQTTANAGIVVLNGAAETPGMSDEKGNFSLSVALRAGANILRIRSISLKGASEVIRTVVYSTADLNATPVPTATPAPTATPKATKKPTSTTTPKPTATPKP